ncbi:hypothetical protein ElyMa_005506100 [Elysia marginata]|uniref:Uncharacterized protein n=1 Tax=Elysia marginata TaxID=1093978 RepID=A0AAV4EU55_9GAST|nr:hypothetical protein ElyMa_005506100 [Elysia marginata]
MTTVSTSFHLINKESIRNMNDKVKYQILPADPSANYLGITLDRRLTYFNDLKGCADKTEKKNLYLEEANKNNIKSFSYCLDKIYIPWHSATELQNTMPWAWCTFKSHTNLRWKSNLKIQ